MKKIFNRFTKLLLTFILLFSDVAPVVKVFADMNPSLTIKASTTQTGTYNEIQNNTTYTFDQSTKIENYYFQLNGTSFDQDEKYLIKTEISFYGTWDKENIHKTKKFVKFVTGGELNSGFTQTAPYDGISTANGIYDINLSIYKLSDIESGETKYGELTDIVLNTKKEELANLNMSGFNKITSNSFKVEVVNLKSGFVINNIEYNNSIEPTASNVEKKENIYEVDNSKGTEIKIKYNYEIGNLNDDEKYHINIFTNSYLTETRKNLTTSDLVQAGLDNVLTIGNFVNGTYTVEFKLYDSKDNLIATDTIEFKSINSTIATTDELLNEYFTLDEDPLNDIAKLRKTLIDYKALSEEDKNKLTEEIKEQLETYVDKINNLSLDKELTTDIVTANSYYKVKENEISIIEGFDGTFDKDVIVSEQISVAQLKSYYQELKISVYKRNGELATDDEFLSTGMKVIANQNSNIKEYYVVVRGNIVSEYGMINIEDIREMISLGLDISTLNDEYYIASDVNKDEEVNILDISETYYILNSDEINTFSEYESEEITNETKIVAKITSDKNTLRVGDTFKVTLNVEELTENAINGIQGNLVFENDLVKCKSVSINNNWIGNINVINDTNYGKFMYVGDSIDKDGSLITFTFEALKEGTARIKINELIAVLNGTSKELENKETSLVEIKINRALDTDARIKELTFDKGNLNKEFDKDTNTYTLYVDYYEDSITINGVLESAYAKTNGFKEYQLSSYKTIIPITVQAENGNIKTYTIEVIKVDRRSSNTNLKELTIEGIDIDFNKDKLEYDIVVDYSVKKLDINAIAEHIKSVVVIEDSNLKVGKNKIIIKVKAENGDTKDYILNVTRKNEVKKDIAKNEETKGNNSRLLLIILIIATISFLLYLIFKDHDKDKDKEPKYNLKEKENKKDTKEQNNNTNDKRKTKK